MSRFTHARSFRAIICILTGSLQSLMRSGNFLLTKHGSIEKTAFVVDN